MVYGTPTLSRRTWIFRTLAWVLVPALLLESSGCRMSWGTVDPQLVSQARLVAQEREEEYPFFDEPRPPPREHGERGSLGEVILGELLAIFPGVLVHGTGHYYAGDYKTARQLLRVGGFGYLLTAIGGGLVTGGYFLDEGDDLPGFAYSLYGTGGLIGVTGVFFFLTAWGYDLVDTPRAVRSGGRPPPRSEFVESLDLIGN